MSQRTVISTESEQPLTITVNVPGSKPAPAPNPKPLTQSHRTVIELSEKHFLAPEPLSKPIAPEPISPLQLPTPHSPKPRTKKIKISKLKSNEDANAYLSGHGKYITEANMKKVLRKKYLFPNNIKKCIVATEVGLLTDLYKIGDFLWLKVKVKKGKFGYKHFTSLDASNTLNNIDDGKIMVWQKELKKYKTATEAFDEIQKTLCDNKFNSSQQQSVLDIISAIQKETEKKYKKRIRKKRKKSISVESDESIDTDLSMKHSNESWKKRKLLELDGFVDYGIEGPPMKRQRLNDGSAKVCEKCWNCELKLSENDKYRCSVCKKAWYCGEKCQTEHWNKIHKSECTKCDESKSIKIERKCIHNWNWYEIIHWFNRIKCFRFNSIEYMNFRKHLYIGKIKGYQLKDINHITLNMIGISEYNKHQMILNVIAELCMGELDTFVNDALNMFKMDDTDIPLQYLDPISYELMSDPVCVKKSKDGICFERKSLEKYVKQYNINPLTRDSVKPKNICANDALKVEIKEWKEQHLRTLEK